MERKFSNIIPSILLILIGLYIARLGVLLYLKPGDDLAYLNEFWLTVFLLLGAATVAVGGYALMNDRPRLSLSGLVGYLVLKLTFTADLYSMFGANTQLTVLLGFALILAAMAATWTISGRLAPRGSGRP